MSQQMQSHLKIALESIRCFTDDGQLDEGEINYLLGLATADGHVDAEERRVLSNILAQVPPGKVKESTRKHIEAVKRQHGLS